MSFNTDTIRRMFSRRAFTPKERETMKTIYIDAEFLAQRINRDIPESVEKDLAILKIKDVLASCEAAVAMHPRDEMNDAACSPPNFKHGSGQIGASHFNGS